MVWKSCVTYKFESDRMISGSSDHKNDDREKRVCWYQAYRHTIKNCEWFSNKSPEAKKKHTDNAVIGVSFRLPLLWTVLRRGKTDSRIKENLLSGLNVIYNK